MGRHSRGGGTTPPPEPEPPAPRSRPRALDDSDIRGRSTYRVVDVGLPPGPPPRSASSFPLGGAGQPLPGSGEPARGRRRADASRADLAPGPDPAPGPAGPARGWAPSPASAGATRADLALPQGPAGAGDHAPFARPGGPARRPPDRGTGLRPPDPADTAAGPRRSPLGPADSGAGLHPLTGPGRPPLGPADSGAGLHPLTGPGRHPLGPADSGAGLHPLTASTPGLHPLAGPGAGLRPRGSTPLDDEAGGRWRGAENERPARRRAADDEAGGRWRGGEDERPTRRRGADDERGGRRRSAGGTRRRAEDGPTRYGATRVDLAAGTLGSTALAPAEPDPLPATAPEPDEVTDTGARRTRSTFHVAEDPEEDEPSLLLQWGVFVAQTLTGAAVGLGVWLAFYRLWSTYPLYAAPAVGVVTIGMLGAAQVLRRRHGSDLDLLTAVVTISVSTVLTVLPAAFTLQSLA